MLFVQLFPMDLLKQENIELRGKDETFLKLERLLQRFGRLESVYLTTKSRFSG